MLHSLGPALRSREEARVSRPAPLISLIASEDAMWHRQTQWSFMLKAFFIVTVRWSSTVPSRARVCVCTLSTTA